MLVSVKKCERDFGRKGINKNDTDCPPHRQLRVTSYGAEKKDAESRVLIHRMIHFQN